MKHVIRWLWIAIVSLLTVSVYAQDPAPIAYALVVGDDGVPQIGEVQLPGNSLFIDWNPQDSNSLARVDDFGMMRFAPINTPEGVYTFSPYFQGYSTPSREENRLYVAEAQWSPNGQQLVFQIASGSEMGNDGVWYWQPAMITSTDPTYHILRDCPPGCGLANSRDTGEWKTLSMDWSPNNVAILVHLYLPAEERNALGVIYASRDGESPQADIQPITFRYEYGSWTNDGERLVVSGYDPEGNVVVGYINQDGRNPQLSAPGELVYVRNAVEHRVTGEMLVLGSMESDTAPVAIFDANGTQRTQLIGNQAPNYVEWSANHDAVFVRVGDQSYIATINGEVYDITETVKNNPMVTWANAGFPPNTTTIPLPEPTVQVAPTPILITVSGDNTNTSGTDSDIDGQTLFIPQTNFAVGQLLQVTVESMTLYAEPIIGAEMIANVAQGEALVLVGGPLTDGVTVWWRIQTLEHVGWAEEMINGITQFSS